MTVIHTAIHTTTEEREKEKESKEIDRARFLARKRTQISGTNSACFYKDEIGYWEKVSEIDDFSLFLHSIAIFY